MGEMISVCDYVFCTRRLGELQGSFQTSVRKAWQQIANQNCVNRKKNTDRYKTCAISWWVPHCCAASNRIWMRSHGTLHKSHLWRVPTSLLCGGVFYLILQTECSIFSRRLGMLSLSYYPLESSTDQYGAFQQVPLQCCVHGVKEQLLMLIHGLLKSRGHLPKVTNFLNTVSSARFPVHHELQNYHLPVFHSKAGTENLQLFLFFCY